MTRSDGMATRLARYAKRLTLLPHTAAEAAERSRAIEARLAAIEAASMPPPVEAPPLSPVTAARRDFPSLGAEHVAGATLYCDREAALAVAPVGGRIAEIGVALGDFSDLMVTRLRPVRFDAYDLFRLHEEKAFWGRTSAEWFAGRTHRQHYEHRFRSAIDDGIMQVHEGDSSSAMEKVADAHYDMIYIDGDHSYEGALKDAEVAARKLAPDGLLVFNDYIMADHVTGSPYGVVPVVNEFCVNHGWQIVYVALQRDLFCDVGLRRRQ